MKALIVGRTAWNGTYSQLAFESISAGFIRNPSSRQDPLDEIEYTMSEVANAQGPKGNERAKIQPASICLRHRRPPRSGI